MAWTSFHLFGPVDQDAFLARHLLPAITRERLRGRIRRMFFIRYSEGGPHVRLRCMLAPGYTEAMATAVLEECLEEYAVASGESRQRFRVVRCPYSRTDHYFGENLLSVYAELLNIATSTLAFRLLRDQPSARAERRWRLAVVLCALFRTSTATAREYARCIEEACAFARDASGGPATGHDPHDVERTEPPSIELRARLETPVASVARDPSVAAVARLLARVRRSGARGRFVATHALHLLCNKMGVSLREEWALMRLLHMATAAEPAPANVTVP